MKKTLPALLLLCLYATLTMAQAHFTWKIDKVSARELQLTFSGSFDPGWHLNEQSLTVEQSRGLRAVGTFANGRQRFAITEAEWSLKGYMEYLVCTDEQCLAPQYVEFSSSGTADLTANAPTAASSPSQGTNGTAPSLPQPTDGSAPSPVRGDTIASSATTAAAPTPSKDINAATPSLVQTDTTTAVAISQAAPLQLMLTAFLAGLLALLTPCVWPVIPLTVSFFLKNGRGRRDALLFGASIIGIFLLLGLGMTLLLGADAMNQLATNAVFNVVCFIALTLFGLSFIGLFNISLPSSWATSLDTAATRRGGTLGILLMALTLVVVSFSCTAPIVGTLLVDIATSSASILSPILGMTAFALALALPFTLFALFPSLMKRMPRSGMWMKHVKVTLGILELAFALKFLSVADMAYGWHLLSWRSFLIVWIVLFSALALYLLLQWRNSRIAALCGLLPLSLTLYLANGLLGGDTRIVSAFMPPRDDVAQTIYTDYHEGIAAAQREQKPIFLDFTGYGCVNCRKMEAAVFTDKRVKELLSRYIIIRLYVDDRTSLNKPQQVKQPDGTMRTLRTVGDRWSYLEQQRFGQLTQPLYVLLRPDGSLLSTTVRSYDEDTEAFLQWLAVK